MGTRGVIARVTNDGFEGRYHHWDSYPDGLGDTLFNLLRGHFEGDIEAMLKILIDDHPAGWSTINDGDFSLPPGYLEITEDMEKAHGPQCYCHGVRDEEGTDLVDMKQAVGIGCEWAYAFNQKRQMVVLSSFNDDGGKMIGMFGMGNPDAKWKIAAIIELDGQEPDWEAISRNGSRNGVGQIPG